MKIEAKTAIRLNEKSSRKKKVIHSLDGCYYSIFPEEIFKVAKKLVKGIDFSSVDYIVTFASFGIALGMAVAIVTKKPLRIAYEKKLDLPNPIIIIEPHLARKELVLYGIKKDDTVVLVDDEVYSGDLLVNAIKTLVKKGVKITSVICLIENTSKNARKKIKKLGFNLKSYKKFSL